MGSNQPDEEAIFKVARAIQSPDVRAAYLGQVCGDDSVLTSRITALLRVEVEQPGFLDSPAAIVTLDRPVTEGPGSLIGPYKLLQELGEGGMGMVFMAEQTRPVERRVALKVIKPGMDTRQVIARFEAERQALAMMDHPGIAKVLDAGATESGRPFFVMELVRGVPITDYCDQHQLTTRERLALFVPVCQAVQHAHQKGVIHRDLKPSNVLVAEYDEEPVAKIIDFGVVKAIGQRLTEKTMFTQVGQLVGTIDYMSPEQAKLNQLDVDTRTDIYSLGVLLYELLSGETPFERKRLRAAALDETLRIIREEEPPPPSTRLSSSGTLPSIAARRHTEPKKLTALVRGELDWIVMKALDKDRSRRYETANGLAMDIERYLADEPVLACPPSAAYRFRKFARRNKATLFAASLILGVLVVGTFVSTWQAVRATRAERLAEVSRAAEAQERQAAIGERRAAIRERNEAEKQRKQAEANLEKAREAVDESFTMISESKLLEVPGLQSLRRDLLEAALRSYQGFSLEDSNDARGMADIAVTYLRIAQINGALDRNDDAISAIRQALDIIERLRREHPSDLESQRRLAGFATERRWGQKDTVVPQNLLAAFGTLMRLENMWEKLAAEHPTTVAFQTDLAGISASIAALLHWSGRHRDASPYFQQSVDIGERLAREYPSVPRYRSALADVSRQYGDNKSANAAPAGALALYQRAVELGEGLVAEFPKVPAYRSGLSSSLVSLGDRLASDHPEQAEKAYRRAVALAQALLDEFPGHRLYLENDIAASVQLAKFEYSRGSYAQTEETLEKLVEELQSEVAAHPEDHNTREGLAFGCLYVAVRVPELAKHDALYESLNRLALGLLTELSAELPKIAIYREHLGHCHQNLGLTNFRANHLDQALYHHENAVELFKELVNEPEGRRYLSFLTNAWRMVSEVQNRQGKLPEAVSAACAAVRLAPDDTAILGRLLDVLSQFEFAERPAEAVSLVEPLLNVEPQDASGWQLRGQVHAVLGQNNEATADFIRAIDLADDKPWFTAPRKLVCRDLARWNEVFDRVAAKRPEETTLWIGRAQRKALRSQWASASKDYAKVMQARAPGDESIEFASALLLLGDKPGYQQFCRELVARTADPQGLDAYYLAFTCSIGQTDGIDASRVVEWANRAAADRQPWTLTSLAVAEYRAGEFDLAIRHFHESNSLPRGDGVRGINLFFLAMAHHRLGQTDAALRSFEKARQLFKQFQPAKLGLRAMFHAPGDWIALHVASAEAETLFQAQSTPTGGRTDVQ